ncbi:hypothetical protein BSKO_05146 [Bryopsis sp. KO-2023]|nr:hypothetical protein BSKO_05146 [Bryopsis sp. KO-2023]
MWAGRFKMKSSDPAMSAGLWAPVTRSFLALFVLTMLGYSIHPPFTEDGKGLKEHGYKFKYHMAFLWAAMTNFFIAAPKVGSIAKVGIQHVLGTILGGLSGVGIIYAASNVDMFMNVYWFTFGMSMVAIVSNFFGWLFKTPETSMLYVVSCILILFSTEDFKSAIMFNETRIFGMIGGVLLSQTLAVLVFPKAATQEVVQGLNKALEGLANLNDAAWEYAAMHAEKELPVRPAMGQSGKQSWEKLSRRRTKILQMRNASKWMQNPRKLDNKGFIKLSLGACKDGQCDIVQAMVTARLEAALMQVYKGLDMAEAAIPLTRTEIAVEFFRGKWFFLPGISWIKRQPLPEAEIAELAWSVRRCARILWTLNMTFQDGLDQEMVYMLKQQYPRDMIKGLKECARECFWELVYAFPSRGDEIDLENVDKFEHGVQALFAINDYQRRRVSQHFNKYKNLALQNEARHNPALKKLKTKASVLRTLTEPTGLAGLWATLTHRDDPEMKRNAEALLKAMSTDMETGLRSANRTISEDISVTFNEESTPAPEEALLRLSPNIEVSHGEEIVSPGSGPSENVMKLDVPGVASKDLLTFPETPEGYVSMVRWYSFQFLLEEVVKATRDLNQNLTDLLSKMPDYGVTG